MSLIFLLIAVYMCVTEIIPDSNFMITWALFAIADALWVKKGN